MRCVLMGLLAVAGCYACIGLYLLSIILLMLAFCAAGPYVGWWSLTVLVPAALGSAHLMFRGMTRCFGLGESF